MKNKNKFTRTRAEKPNNSSIKLIRAKTTETIQGPDNINHGKIEDDVNKILNNKEVNALNNIKNINKYKY